MQVTALPFDTESEGQALIFVSSGAEKRQLEAQRSIEAARRAAFALVAARLLGDRWRAGEIAETGVSRHGVHLVCALGELAAALAGTDEAADACRREITAALVSHKREAARRA